MVDDWKDWSKGWIQEGHFISYVLDNAYYFEYVQQRDFAHWEYDWAETVTTSTESGPVVPQLLEITKGYDKRTNTNQIWQLIFGIKSQAYVYVELPTDLHRHGIPKRPKPGSSQWTVSHFEEWMSPMREPSFITEHFMMRPVTSEICVSAYNPNNISLTDLKLNFMINKMITVRVGTVQSGIQSPSTPRWTEALDKLYRRVIPCRPITLMPVRAPAEAPGGE